MAIIVSASHVSPNWRLDSVRFSVIADGDAHQSYRVGGDAENGYYAIAPQYGCSKSRSTPELAIRSLLTDNGCTCIHIRAN